MLPEPIWKAMTEVNLFFRDLCSTTLKVKQLKKMERNIMVTMCKLEKILPPGFFDHMEHLLVHLSYKARVGGPEQYRWMYPFERYLYHLNKKVKNKSRVECSICEAYIMEEISNFCTHYFESYVETNSRRVGRNDDGGNLNPNRFSLSIFNHPGRPSGTYKRRYLDDDDTTFRKFKAELKVKMPNVTSAQLIRATEERFRRWIRDYVLNQLNSNLVSDNLKSLAIGPSQYTRTWQLYYVNGFNFHTMHHSFGRKTSNTDLCIVGEEGDYYGQLNDVIELEYMYCSKVVLFKCEWFDPVKHRGWKIHNEFGLVDINHKKKLRNYDPFIMEHQAQQVYFISYPSMRRDKNDWWAVCRTKAKSTIVSPTQPIDSAYQEDGAALPFHVTENDEVEKLHDDKGDMEVVEVQHLQDHESEEVEDLTEEESDEEEELEYENGSGEDNKAKEKDEWLDNFKDKEIWFNSFKEKYTWDAKINIKVRSLFNTLGSISLRDYMTRMRIKGRAHKPPFMHQTVWDALWTIWESPEFIAKSDRGRAARQSNKRLHVAGSVSIAEHKRRLQKELGRDPTAAELFFRTHVKKDMKTFVDSEAKETWSYFLLMKEKYMEKYEAEDTLDKKSGNIANTYIRWADHVGSKKGKFYGLPSGFDRYIFEHIVDSIGQTSQNHEMVQLREMLDCQKIQYDLLKAEQERTKTTQEAHTEKLDQVAKSHISLEDYLKLIQGATQKVLDLLHRRQPTI
uniref:Transposon-like protein n=1 Tax=Tanacetum cinerariifolium TaxID=118510 RepID=A0A6L2P0F5_TANCI|nr:transposon-like protein [Tanacetum cinerariifolium]